MASTTDNSNPQRDGPAPWLRRLDQATVAGLLAVSLALMGISALARYWQSAGLIEIDQAAPTTVDFRVDINQAEWPELALLPDVGEALARRIVESRQTVGPFRDQRDLLRVSGIGPAKLAAMRPYLLPLPAAGDVASAASLETAVQTPAVH